MAKDVKGALNVERRTWDLEFYEKKAKERLEAGEEGTAARKPGIVRKREEFQSADEGAAGPEGSKRAYLKGRSQVLNLEEKLGKTQVVTSHTAPQQQGGYWCDVCQCLLKDSLNYLDHINGKKHQRALGYSMRVERVDVGKVRGRLQQMKQDDEVRRMAAPKQPALKEYEDRLLQQEEEQERRREELKAKREEARRQKAEAEKDGEGDDNTADIDPELAAAMGFAGFK